MTEATAINPVLEIKEKVFASTFYFPDIYSITLCYLRLYEYYLSREKMLELITKAIKNPRRAAEKTWNILRRTQYQGQCSICGIETIMYKYGKSLTETNKCKKCGAIARNRHLAIVLCKVFGVEKPFSMKKFVENSKDLAVYEAQGKGPLNFHLKKLQGYACSEYDPDVQPGSDIQEGIRCEDLQNLTFEDETFDLVITQTVFEHILEPDKAWKEIARVLKPSGYHIFSIPFQNSPITERRVKIDDGEEIFIMPKVYHNDGVRNSLVYTDYGLDLLDHLKDFGFSTELHSLGDMDSNTYRIDGGYIFISLKDRH